MDERNEEQEEEQEEDPFHGFHGSPKRNRLILEGEFKKLGSRSIREDTCRKFNYYCNDDHGQIANYYDRDSQLVFQKIRGRGKRFSSRGDIDESTLFGQQLWSDKQNSKRIVITEGEIDCLTVAQVFNCTWPVVSIPNGTSGAKKALKKQISFLERFNEIVLFFDNDKPGREATLECVSLFTPGKVKVVSYSDPDVKDPSDLLQIGKGKEIANMVFNAKTYRPDGIILASDLKEDIYKFISGEGEKGYSIPFPKKLDEMIDGIRKGEITTFCAGTKIGKSTVVNEIAYHFLMRHKLRIGVIALEESPVRTCLRYLSIGMNKTLHRSSEGIDREKFDKVFTEVVDDGRLYLYKHFGSLESDSLLEKMRYLAVGVNCDFIIFDHISMAVSGQRDGDERRIIDNLMTDIRSLCENTGVGCLVVSHLTRSKGTSFEEGGQVSLSYLRGSGAIGQISDTIIGFERNLQADGSDTGIMNCRLLACRWTGESGLAGRLKYNKETGRIEEYRGEDEFITDTQEGEEIDDF